MLGRVIRIAVPVALGCALTIAGAAALGDIPDSTTGVISGCYQSQPNDGGPPVGTLRVIDAQGGVTCSQGETPLSWNQTGPTGARGPAGPQGPSTLYTARRGQFKLCDRCEERIFDKRLPSGNFLYGAKLLVENLGSAPASVLCVLTPGEASGADDGFVQLAAKGDPGYTQTISLQTYTKVGVRVLLDCTRPRGGTVSASSIMLTALAVGQINPPQRRFTK